MHARTHMCRCAHTHINTHTYTHTYASCATILLHKQKKIAEYLDNNVNHKDPVFKARNLQNLLNKVWKKNSNQI